VTLLTIPNQNQKTFSNHHHLFHLLHRLFLLHSCILSNLLMIVVVLLLLAVWLMLLKPQIIPVTIITTINSLLALLLNHHFTLMIHNFTSRKKNLTKWIASTWLFCLNRLIDFNLSAIKKNASRTMEFTLSRVINNSPSLSFIIIIQNQNQKKVETKMFNFINSTRLSLPTLFWISFM
jgi:hypothetical protein